MRLLQHPGMGQYGAMGSPMPMPMSSMSPHPNMYQGQGLLPPNPQNHSLSPSPGMLQPPPVVSPRPHSTGKPGLDVGQRQGGGRCCPAVNKL